MTRNSFFFEEPPKVLNANDIPSKPKQAVHLVTYPNFLTADFDHSSDRPFTNSKPHKSRRNFERPDLYHSRDEDPQLFQEKPTYKKQLPQTQETNKSSYNLIAFEPGQQETRPTQRPLGPRGTSSLQGCSAQPQLYQPERPTKRQIPKEEGVGVRMSLFYS